MNQNFEMDRCILHRACFCPISCVINARNVLFAAIAVFVLYYPLGDPQVQCEAASKNEQIALPYICEAYFALQKTGSIVLEGIKFTTGAIMNILYDAMLKLYALFESTDKQPTPDSTAVNIGPSDDTLKPTDVSPSPSQTKKSKKSSKHCPKCNEKGATCVKDCPYMKGKKK